MKMAANANDCNALCALCVLCAETACCITVCVECCDDFLCKGGLKQCCNECHKNPCCCCIECCKFCGCYDCCCVKSEENSGPARQHMGDVKQAQDNHANLQHLAQANAHANNAHVQANANASAHVSAEGIPNAHKQQQWPVEGRPNGTSAGNMIETKVEQPKAMVFAFTGVVAGNNAQSDINPSAPTKTSSPVLMTPQLNAVTAQADIKAKAAARMAGAGRTSVAPGGL
jgi:hypothetical protein